MQRNKRSILTMHIIQNQFYHENLSLFPITEYKLYKTCTSNFQCQTTRPYILLKIRQQPPNGVAYATCHQTET